MPSQSAQDNAAEGFSYLRRASTQDVTSSSQNMDLEAAYVNDRAAGKFGVAPSAVTNGMRMEALDDMNRQRTGSGAEQEALKNDRNEWIKGLYASHLDNAATGNHVLRDIARYQNHAEGGVKTHHDAGEGVAGRVNDAISDNTFNDPRPGDIKAPNVEDGLSRRANRRGANNAIYEDNGVYNLYRQVGI